MQDAVITVICAPDDGWSYHPKNVERAVYRNIINCIYSHLVGQLLTLCECSFTRNLSINKSEMLYFKWIRCGCRPEYRVANNSYVQKAQTPYRKTTAYCPRNRLQFEFHSITTRKPSPATHSLSYYLTTRLARVYISYV